MMFFAVFFTASAAQQQWPVVLKGVLEGFGLTKDLDEMKDCLAKTESEIKDVEAAIQLLEKKDAHDVLDGLGKLGSALELLPTAVQNCDAAAKDVHPPLILKSVQSFVLAIIEAKCGR